MIISVGNPNLRPLTHWDIIHTVTEVNRSDGLHSSNGALVFLKAFELQYSHIVSQRGNPSTALI